MRWLQAGVGVLTFMMSGCPSGFGKEGRVAKAAHQDTLGIVRKYCAPEERARVCEGDKKDSPDCRACGG